jgi:phage shock protein A
MDDTAFNTALEPNQPRPEDLGGMSPAAAKEYIAGFISTLKLTEKEIAGLAAEWSKWNSRVELAAAQGRSDLALEAGTEAERIKSKQTRLLAEADALQSQIEQMRRQLPLLAAQERRIDPDLLEQELLIAAGRMPGDTEKARTGRMLDDIEREAAADAALAELKAKMERNRQ